MLRRIAPALLLLVLAPLTAEFLLGDFTIRQLPFLLVLIPQYGGGALLIRADLREADLTRADLLGADLRDADVRGSLLEQSWFLTQAQLNTARGDGSTQIPAHLTRPGHWAA